VAAIALVVAVVALASSSIRMDLAGNADLGSFYSRERMWHVTAEAIAQTFPVGTGLGTFDKVYALHENPALVAPTYINHAHNDYLELVLELGLAGIVLIGAGLAWWGWQAVSAWRSPLGSSFAKAATIASAAILAHSIVDYPLRSSAIAVVFAAALASLPQPVHDRERPQARHVTIA
jgi:O-antigen ligase